MGLTDPGGILVLRMDVARTIRWLIYASLGLIGIAALFIAAVTSNAYLGDRSPLPDAAFGGVIFAGFLALFVFALIVLRNQRIYVDSLELTVTSMLGKSIRFPRGLIDRVEQYRRKGNYGLSPSYWYMRIVCTDGRSSNLLRLSARNSKRLADFLGVRLVPPPTGLERLVQGFEGIFGPSAGAELRRKLKDRLSDESASRPPE